MGKAKDMANELAKTPETATVSANDIFGEELTSVFHDIVSADYSSTFTLKQADGSYIDSSKFHLAKKMGSVTDKAIYNEDLKAITNRIFGINELAKHSARLVAVELNKADKLRDADGNSVLVKEGFKNVGEYGYYVFGIKDKTVNQYVRIANLFYDEVGNMVDSRLPKLSTSQCIPLLARVDNEETKDIHTIISWFTPDDDDNSLLTGGMGAGKIKERLDSLDKGFVDSHGRSLLSAEERKARKAEEQANKEVEESNDTANELVEESKPHAEKKYTPEQAVCAMYLKTLSAVNELAEKADEETKKRLTAIAEKMESLKAEVLALANIEE